MHKAHYLEVKVTTFDLSDLLIAHTVKTSGISSILTFDKRSAQYTLFELLI
ncbi:hypothetical protein BAZOLSSOX_2008 [uncultured Gammaproteobacteria bacterium]|nr:hypothetical protein BAZOLSSOX_2008 [uncultured Gammaproteobacteria bacterium]